MNALIKLRVWRRLDNRREGLPDDSPRAVELHERRGVAVHEVVDDNPLWLLIDLGLTDCSEAHEMVEVLLRLKTVDMEALKNIVDIPSLRYLGGILRRATLDAAMAEAVKDLIARLKSQMMEERITDFRIVMPDGLLVWCGPTYQNSAVGDQRFAITVYLPNGSSVMMNYEATEQDIIVLRGL